MRPDARVQAAIEVVDLWRAGDEGVDRVLTAWGRVHRFAGSGDRRAIADLVYDALRRKRSALWVADAAPDWNGRDLLRGSLRLDGAELDRFFTGAVYAPASLEEAERAAARDLEAASRAVRLDYPDWLEPELATAGDKDLAAFRLRGEVWLRVNLLKAGAEDARRRLGEDGIEVQPFDQVPGALRVTAQARRVAQSRAYLEGLVEIQDAGSQAVAALARARPGETVLDLCAGGGGKTLALAAAMRNEGELWAYDAAPQRLSDLPARARRAGAVVEILDEAALRQCEGREDLVFVDAPCSGSGVWRRNPDAKWRLTPAGLADLQESQAAILDRATCLAAPSGRICYATCSVLRSENRAQVEAFRSRHEGWSLLEECQTGPSSGMDGFYGALMTRAPGTR